LVVGEGDVLLTDLFNYDAVVIAEVNGGEVGVVRIVDFRGMA
jgi:hypothetical protein